jgi:hypothetical protein
MWSEGNLEYIIGGTSFDFGRPIGFVCFEQYCKKENISDKKNCFRKSITVMPVMFSPIHTVKFFSYLKIITQ